MKNFLQPQWVFDCVNARLLLPTKSYFPGSPLPPHLSPFVEEREGDYVPPEKKKLLELQSGIGGDANERRVDGEEEEDEEEEEDDAEDSVDGEDEEESEQESEVEGGEEEEKEEEEDDDEDDDDDDEDDDQEDEEEEADASSDDEDSPKLKRPRLTQPEKPKHKSLSKEQRLEKMSVSAGAPKRDNSLEMNFQVIYQSIV